MRLVRLAALASLAAVVSVAASRSGLFVRGIRSLDRRGGFFSRRGASAYGGNDEETVDRPSNRPGVLAMSVG